MSETYPPPSGPPPTSRAAAPAQPSRQDSLEGAIPDEPPPAYSSIAGPSGDTTVAAGPSRMDFSGPPPMPDRLTQNITGVGVGYGPRPPAQSPSGQVGNSWGISPQQTGSSWESPHTLSNNPFGDQNRPPPPPKHPSISGTYPTPPGPPLQHASPNASGSRPQQDLSPTEAPTPGRPLLYKGQMLVYPKGHFCHKCGNTGYKANDPSNPCNSDWRKYGKSYGSALAHSYTISVDGSVNPSTSTSSNFQRPLPNFTSATGGSVNAGSNHHSYGHLPPPPGQWHAYPGQRSSQPPPPPPPPHAGLYGPPQQHYMPHPGPHPGMPSQPLVVQPGDPRIGGRLCYHCGGSGREMSLFGFDDGKCWECRGLGRVF